MFQEGKAFLIFTALNTSVYLYITKAHCFKCSGECNKKKENHNTAKITITHIILFQIDI